MRTVFLICQFLIVVGLLLVVRSNWVALRKLNKIEERQILLLPVLDPVQELLEDVREIKVITVSIRDSFVSLQEEVVETPLPPAPDESHKAWKNRVEQPKLAPITPHGPPPVPGPLERPYGFSR
jgi:hypothetical protein